MPNIDEEARRWQMDLSGRIGEAVRFWRADVRSYSASKLSQRCVELGFPITRVAVTKIENNMRSGKIDVSELLILARALDISPIQLLYPALPYGEVENTPDHRMRSLDALQWFEGHGQVYYNNPHPEIMKIAGEEPTPDDWAKHEANTRYSEATQWLAKMDDVAALEYGLGRATSQLRHPMFSARTEDAAARREALVERLGTMTEKLESLLDDLEKNGFTTYQERPME